LEWVQEKAVKMVSGLKSNSYQERCAELRLETLEKSRTDQDLVLTHKMLTAGRFRESGVLKQFRETGGTTTRMASDPKNLLTQFARTELRKGSFGIRVTESWNVLTSEQKHARDGKTL
jgi:hypothetical protein